MTAYIAIAEGGVVVGRAPSQAELYRLPGAVDAAYCGPDDPDRIPLEARDAIDGRKEAARTVAEMGAGALRDLEKRALVALVVRELEGARRLGVWRAVLEELNRRDADDGK